MQANVLADKIGKCFDYVDSRGMQSDSCCFDVKLMHVVSCCLNFKSSCVESPQTLCICATNSLLCSLLFLYYSVA